MTRVEIHKQLCDSTNQLYVAKNADYGDSYSKLRAKYPESICIRIEDKLSRLEQLMKPGYDAKVSDESKEDTLIDLANYCLMEVTEMRYEKQEKNLPMCHVDLEDVSQLETIWSLGADGVTERYNMAGGFNDLELYKRSDGLGFELWMNSMIAFANDDEIVSHLDNLETALWKYTYASEPDNKYEIQWDDIAEFGDTIKGKTITEVATKFSFYVDAFVRHVREKDHA